MFVFSRYSALTLVGLTLACALPAEQGARPPYGYYQTQWSRWGDHPPPPPPQAPPAQTSGRSEASNCPTAPFNPSEGTLDELALNVASLPRVARTGDAYAQALLGQVLRETNAGRKIAKADQVATKVLDTLDDLRNTDLGSALSLAGELAQHVSPRVQARIKEKLLGVSKWIDTKEGYARYLDDEDPLQSAVDSALDGLRKMATARLLSAADKTGLARLRKIPALAHVIQASIEASGPEERQQIIREAFRDFATQGLDRLKLSAYRLLARHVPQLAPETMAQFETAFVDTMSEMKTRRGRSALQDAVDEETAVHGAAFFREAARSFAGHPATASAVEGVLTKAGVHLPRGVENFQQIATRTHDALTKEAGAERENLRKVIIEELGPLAFRAGIDILGAVDPTSTCNVIGICLDVAHGDYLSAAISAIALLPAAGKVGSLLNLGRRGKKIQALATKALGLINKLSHLRQRVQVAANVAGIAIDTARQLGRGELPSDESLARLLELGIGGARGRSHASLVRNLAGDVRRVHTVLRADHSGPLDVAAGLLDLPRGENAGTCAESPLDKMLRQFDEKLRAPMRQARRQISQRLEQMWDRVLPFRRAAATVSPFVARGAMPDEDPEPASLEQTVAQRLGLDLAQRAKLRTLVAAANPPPTRYQEMFLYGLASED